MEKRPGHAGTCRLAAVGREALCAWLWDEGGPAQASFHCPAWQGTGFSLGAPQLPVIDWVVPGAGFWAR